MPCLAQSRNYPMLQKSLKPGRRFSRPKPTQAKVATKSDSGPITEVTDELSARSCDPPHPYTKNAPTAQKFSDQRCKRTFATVSANSRLIQSHLIEHRQFGDHGGRPARASALLSRALSSLRFQANPPSIYVAIDRLGRNAKASRPACCAALSSFAAARQAASHK